MPDGSSSAAPVTNPGPSNRNKIFARLYGGLSGSALVEFMAPVQLKPYELQYFYAPRPTCVSRLMGASLLKVIGILTQCRCRCEAVGRHPQAQLSWALP